MSNKQLLNEGGLSRGDRQNRLYSVGGSLWLTKLWSKSESWEVVPPEQAQLRKVLVKTGNKERPEHLERLEWLLQLSPKTNHLKKRLLLNLLGKGIIRCVQYKYVQ